jgi:hypothetical protein
MILCCHVSSVDGKIIIGYFEAASYGPMWESSAQPLEIIECDTVCFDIHFIFDLLYFNQGILLEQFGIRLIWVGQRFRKMIKTIPVSDTAICSETRHQL